MTNPIHIRAFYPADPAGIVPGGVDTFLRGILKYAPDDLRFSLVGMTTNESERPVGRWTKCRLGGREFDFYPVVRVVAAGQRSRVPLSLRYTAAVAMRLRSLKQGFDVFEFHRIEPALLFLGDPRPKNAFFHQDMAVIRSDKADIVWRHMPSTYFAIERRIIDSLSSAWCVRQEGVRAMRDRYPLKADSIRFVPTWVDTEVFSPLGISERQRLRADVAKELDIDPSSRWIITVGRLDSQKDPQLMLHALSALIAKGIHVQWLIVGDGVLRADLEKLVVAGGLQRSARFLGLRSAQQIAVLLRSVDVFALSSAYEGMPMALLEALGTGVPVATTDVGEVRQVVFPHRNGAIASERSIAAFSNCLEDVVLNCERYSGAPALEAIAEFQPRKVLASVFDNYRLLGARRTTVRQLEQGHQ